MQDLIDHNKKGSSMRYRCHTGHAYTVASLLAKHLMKIEATMWPMIREPQMMPA